MTKRDWEYVAPWFGLLLQFARADADALLRRVRRPSRRVPPVISNGAGRLFLPASLLRSGRPAQREISLLFNSATWQHALALPRVRGEGLRCPSAGFRREPGVFFRRSHQKPAIRSPLVTRHCLCIEWLDPAKFPFADRWPAMWLRPGRPHSYLFPLRILLDTLGH